MRISASGEQSMIAVAIDQILRLAPSISGPIEPVVSSTKATSTTGLAAAGVVNKNDGASAKASAAACTTWRNMVFPPARPWAKSSVGFASGSGPNCGRPSTDSRYILYVSTTPRRRFFSISKRDKTGANDGWPIRLAMQVDGKPTRTIWLEADGRSVGIIDQTKLPHRFV